ncbi:MAG: asparagine synthase (glutamine-hydrolyzing) [Planctomycetes bacterium]|nr:asparagine synthase (glutamine-hydrolyzing) [Planctomycetota bacterium]
MCGIAGIVNLAGGAPEPTRVARMNTVQAHRGPDGEGLYAEGPVVFGHRRLAIVDLSERGAQPMTLEDVGLTVTYNGEVYNHVELRAELEASGVSFRTDSDTEVVLRAYAAWGVDAFSRFNGMWALAIHDARAQQLVLARDRFGIKPLYLARRGDELLFASEIKALLVAEPDLRAIDEVTLASFLAYGVQDDAPRTFFVGVEPLRSGTVRTYDLRSGTHSSRGIWSYALEEARERYDFERPAETLRELLADAVRLRLRSDVPVGTCLSGGLDSSSVVALAARHGPVRTFTATYPDRGLDEGPYAQAVVERYGCEARRIAPRPGPQLVSLLDRIGWFHDEPCLRPGMITQYFVMASAQGQVSVLLDGQGGDELLLGYASYAVPYLRTLAQEALQHPLDWDLKLKFWRDGRGLLGQPSASNLGSGSFWRLALEGVIRRLRRSAPQLAPSLQRHLAARGAQAPLAGANRIDAALYRDLTELSIPALLHHEDRTSMAFSIEARVPFLDHRVVEFALALDYREKVQGGLMKSVLRDAMRELLPASVVNRPDKLGYPTPVGRWLLEDAANVKEALLDGFAGRGLIARDQVEAAWAAHERGQGDPWLLYRWLSTELWLARFIDRPPVLHPPVVGDLLEAGRSASLEP